MKSLTSLEDWGHLRRDLVWVRRGGIEDRHRHRGYLPAGRIVAWRLLGGRISFRLSSGRFQAKAGQWVFPGNGAGERTFSKNAELVSVRFHANWPGAEQLFDHARPILAGGDEALSLDEAAFALADFVRDELDGGGQPLARVPAALEQHLTLRTLHDRWFLAYVGLMLGRGQTPRPPPRLDARIREAVSLMESKLRQGQTLTEEQVAQNVGLSLSQFKRLFGRDLNTTPKQWLDALRFELACDRLNQGARTVKEIGYELGFGTPHHFSAWFRRRGGCPPGRFARRVG